MEQVKTDNELIAEFMGLPPQYKDGTGYVHTDEDGLTWGYNSEELEYHLKWSWLMPVVEKILSIKIEGFGTDAAHFRGKRYGVSGLALGTPIKEVYSAVIQFIKWYNEQKS